MGAINSVFNRTGWSILALANATAKYRAQRNEEGKNKAKQSYSTVATIKKQNNELTQNQVKAPKSYFSDNLNIPPEIDEQKIAEQTVLEEMAHPKSYFTDNLNIPPKMDEQKITEQKVLDEMTQAKATSFSELPTVSAEHSETNISAKDPEVQGLIEAKQKNALKAASSKRSQERYQNIKEKLTYVFADEHNIDDVWRNISLDPNITDEMIKKAGLTKTKILEEWKWYNDSPTDWIEKQNIRGEEYGVVGGIADAEDFSSFGRLLSAYIKAKAEGKTLAQQQEEYELSKAEEENYKVWQDDSIWQDDSTEEEKDEVKTDRDFSGIKF